MYNVFRLTGRYAEAAYLRELFDEPATVLYQVAALVRTIDEAAQPGAEFDREALLTQADQLVMSAVAALEGRAEAEMVRHLARIRESLARFDAPDRAADVHEVSATALDAVNVYFRERLEALPSIREYLTDLAVSPV
jgi:histidine ammonia-lyase